MKISLEDFSAKVWREDIFKQQLGTSIRMKVVMTIAKFSM
jgi:hypothetical protein